MKNSKIYLIILQCFFLNVPSFGVVSPQPANDKEYEKRLRELKNLKEFKLKATQKEIDTKHGDESALETIYKNHYTARLINGAGIGISMITGIGIYILGSASNYGPTFGNTLPDLHMNPFFYAGLISGIVQSAPFIAVLKNPHEEKENKNIPFIIGSIAHVGLNIAAITAYPLLSFVSLPAIACDIFNIIRYGASKPSKKNS